MRKDILVPDRSQMVICVTCVAHAHCILET